MIGNADFRGKNITTTTQRQFDFIILNIYGNQILKFTSQILMMTFIVSRDKG